MPEHTHLVLARHKYSVEQMANLLRGAATRQLMEEDCHPLAQFAKDGGRPPRMWAEHPWKVFLDSDEAIEDAIAYVENNPVEEGKPPSIGTLSHPMPVSNPAGTQLTTNVWFPRLTRSRRRRRRRRCFAR